MVLVQQERPWDGRSLSPHYLNVPDHEDRKVMDLSTYGSSSPMMMCCGSSPGDTVLRLGGPHRPSSVGGPSSTPPSSVSPQPSRSVITSVSSLQHPSSSTSPAPYRPNGALYYPLSSPLSLAPGPIRLSVSGLGAHHHHHQLPPRKKKLPQPIPEECKDDAYWERRKRNNESAKRSRELRRNKEMVTAERVSHLESENLQLRTEVSMLRNEVEKLRQLLIPKSSVNAS